MPAPYRHRTWLRGRLPSWMGRFVPPGKDCGPGRHEWVASEPVDEAWMCIHCHQETSENPYGEAEWARLRALALAHVACMRLEGPCEDHRFVAEGALEELASAEGYLRRYLESDEQAK